MLEGVDVLDLLERDHVRLERPHGLPGQVGLDGRSGVVSERQG